MDIQTIQQKLKELDELRAALIRKVQTEDKITALEKMQPMIKPGSAQHEALLAAGYGMDRKKAEIILKEREAEPTRWPYEMKEKAEAFLAALEAKPEVISTRQPWRTRHHSRVTTAR